MLTGGDGQQPVRVVGGVLRLAGHLPADAVELGELALGPQPCVEQELPTRIDAELSPEEQSQHQRVAWWRRIDRSGQQVAQSSGAGIGDREDRRARSCRRQRFDKAVTFKLTQRRIDLSFRNEVVSEDCRAETMQT